jgi:DNA-binding winged helix-turn-helix (wHTH) protein
MSGPRFAFGPFVLNLENGTLLRHGLPVAVGYRGIRLLGAFVKTPGEVLTKSALIDAAWQGMAVEEGNLTVQIASLRKLLGPPAAGGEWIATVPRVGYRFTGRVETRDAIGILIEDPAEPGPSIAVLPFANLSDDSEQRYFADGLVEDIIINLARLRWLLVSARNSSFTYRGKTVDVKQVGRELGVRYVLAAASGARDSASG